MLPLERKLLEQGFWYFARSWTHEIHVFPRIAQKTRNTAKSARNISKYISREIGRFF